MSRSFISFAFLCIVGGALAKPRQSVLTFNKPVHVQGREVSQNLYIDNAYHDAGKWGIIELCADGSFAHAVEIKYQGPGHIDETAINAVKLYCQDSTTLIDTGYVTSSTGTHGDWYGMAVCSGDFITGFRANVLEHQGLFVDDVAVEDFEADCNYGMEILDALPIAVPKNFKAGVWSSFATCQAGKAVCGIQTRYEDGSLGDEAAIVDVVLFCCDK